MPEKKKDAPRPLIQAPDGPFQPNATRVQSFVSPLRAESDME